MFDLLDESLQGDIVQIVAGLPAGDACVLTGSLAEGLGNSRSDVDVYIISADPRMAPRSTAIGFRGSRYLDCVYMSAASLKSLSLRINELSSDDLWSVRLEDIDRYYRIHIGERIKDSDDLSAIIGSFSREAAARVLRMWAERELHAHLARGAVALLRGESLRAAIHFRQARAWFLNISLCSVGSAYPAIKWTVERLAAAGMIASRSEQEQALREMTISGQGLQEQLAILRRRAGDLPACRSYSHYSSMVLRQGLAAVTSEDHVILLDRRKGRLWEAGWPLVPLIQRMLSGASATEALAFFSGTVDLTQSELTALADVAFSELEREGLLSASEGVSG
jgi:hypothetical protein